MVDTNDSTTETVVFIAAAGGSFLTIFTIFETSSVY